MTSTIYDFVADEVYRSLAPEEQNVLTKLSVAPRIDAAAIHAMFGSDSDTVIASLSRSGLLGQTEGGDLDVHPLLRSFLIERFVTEDADQMRELAETLIEHYCAQGAWDDAFAVADAHELPQVIPELLDGSLESFLAAGRWATIETWLESVRGADRSLPSVQLAHAECAFRRGEFALARLHALRAADSPACSSQTSTRALIVAAQASYFIDDHESAALAERARTSAQSVAERRSALWVEFLNVYRRILKPRGRGLMTLRRQLT